MDAVIAQMFSKESIINVSFFYIYEDIEKIQEVFCNQQYIDMSSFICLYIAFRRGFNLNLLEISILIGLCIRKI